MVPLLSHKDSQILCWTCHLVVILSQLFSSIHVPPPPILRWGSVVNQRDCYGMVKPSLSTISSPRREDSVDRPCGDVSVTGSASRARQQGGRIAHQRRSSSTATYISQHGDDEMRIKIQRHVCSHTGNIDRVADVPVKGSQQSVFLGQLQFVMLAVFLFWIYFYFVKRGSLIFISVETFSFSSSIKGLVGGGAQPLTKRETK